MRSGPAGTCAAYATTTPDTAWDLGFGPSWLSILLGRAKSQMQALAAGHLPDRTEDQHGKDGRGDALHLVFHPS